MTEDKHMTDWAEVSKQTKCVQGVGNELIASFQRMLWGEKIARARAESVKAIAKGMGSGLGRTFGASHCGCEHEVRFEKAGSRFVRSVARSQSYFILSPWVYFVHFESNKLLPYLRVFEFVLEQEDRNLVFFSLEEVEKHLGGGYDLLVLQGSDLENPRKTLIKRLFDLRVKGTESAYIFEFHYIPGPHEEYLTMEKSSRWTPILKNGKLLFQEFLRIQFSNIETLEEILQ